MRVSVLLILAGWASILLAADQPKPQEGILKVGDAAPQFELKRLGAEKPVKLADLKGKPVVLVFGSCT